MIVDTAPLANPVTVADLDPVAAAYALHEIEQARDYWARRIGFLTRIRGPLDADPTEVELAVKVAKLDEAARTLRGAMYPGDLDDGNHFAGMPPRRDPGVHRLTVVGDAERIPEHAAHLHRDGSSIAPPFIAGCPRCDLEFYATVGQAPPAG